MKYTKQLLNRYISSDTDVQELARELTLKVCEVEEIITRHLPELVVIGKVLEAQKHPDADKLTVCQLDCGKKGTFQICTGAENIRTNIYVAVALPGCFLSAIDLQIDPRKMRGLESNGMICSKHELGIEEDLDLHGIWILQEVGGKTTGDRQHDGDFTDITDAQLGKSLGEVYPRLENRIIDVENKTITHRPDLFGHFGLAREYQALFAKQIRFCRLPQIQPYLEPASLLHTLQHAQQSSREVEINSPAVGAYHLIDLENVTVKESSLALRLHLIDLGITPRNNRVDFSNYFMHLSGQPIHCFDADQISGTLTVRQAKKGEKFVDLFDTEHSLTTDDLVIADEKKVLALAGLIGGKESGITEKTKNVTIEVAQFDPVMIRKTAMRLGMRTDAQTRFEKNIAPLATTSAVLACMDELNYRGPAIGERSLAGIQTWLSDEVPTKNRTISYAPEQINRLIGTDLSSEEMGGYLSALGFGFNTAKTECIVPLRRGPDDMLGSADLAEEVARLYGFDRVGMASYNVPLQTTKRPTDLMLRRQVEEWVCHRFSYTQIETYPWIAQRRHAAFQATPKTCLEMENFLAPELNLLRPTMVPSMLEAIEKNAPFFTNLSLFDIGKIRDLSTTPVEHEICCLVGMSPASEQWQESRFLQMKGQISGLLAACSDLPIQFIPSTHTRGHTIQQADIMLGTTLIGNIGSVHPELKHMIGLESDIQLVIAQIDLTTLGSLETKTDEPIAYKSLQDQIVIRDISFVLPKDMPYGSVVTALTTLPSIQHIQLADLYTGPQVGEGQKSITLRFEIVGDGTMTTDQINAVLQEAISVGQKAGAKVRG